MRRSFLALAALLACPSEPTPQAEPSKADATPGADATPEADTPPQREPSKDGAGNADGVAAIVAKAREGADREPTIPEHGASPHDGPHDGLHDGDDFDGDRVEAVIEHAWSRPGEPNVVGCADGQREGFADVTAHPEIAGCLAAWAGSSSLRDEPSGTACGDDGEECAVPADACAKGWHVCGRSGKAKDIADRTTVTLCGDAGPGRFNAAISHSPSDEIDPCPTITAGTKLPCAAAGLGSEPVCCGQGCKFAKCKDGVWKGKTRISRGTTEGCGSVTSERNPGVLCCVD